MISATEQDTINQVPVGPAAKLQPDPPQADSSYCFRNSIADVTFTQGNDFFKNLHVQRSDKTLINIAGETALMKSREKQILMKHLKEGENLKSSEVRDDWFLFIILVAGLLLTVVRATSKSSDSFLRFFLFRGVNDPDSRDSGGLFYWQTTLFNMLAFLVLSMFIYRTARHYNFIPDGMGDAIFWLLSLAAVMVALTIRHIICYITGNLSEQRDAFNEYLVSIYQFYQYSALFLMVPVILVSYTSVLSSSALLMAGFVILGLMYLFRVGRLLVIFINRNISIFYLILYLCALEILPVSILIRYFSGHV